MKKLLLFLFAAAVVGAAGTMTYKVANSKPATLSLLAQNLQALTDAAEAEPVLWFRSGVDCVFSGKGKRNSTISVTINGKDTSVGVNSDGEWNYSISNGETHCTSGGHEQCKATYCSDLA